jgi:hypothetical protein
MKLSAALMADDAGRRAGATLGSMRISKKTF